MGDPWGTLWAAAVAAGCRLARTAAALLWAAYRLAGISAGVISTLQPGGGGTVATAAAAAAGAAEAAARVAGVQRGGSGPTHVARAAERQSRGAGSRPARTFHSTVPGPRLRASASEARVARPKSTSDRRGPMGIRPATVMSPSTARRPATTSPSPERITSPWDVRTRELSLWTAQAEHESKRTPAAAAAALTGRAERRRREAVEAPAAAAAAAAAAVVVSVTSMTEILELWDAMTAVSTLTNVTFRTQELATWWNSTPLYPLASRPSTYGSARANFTVTASSPEWTSPPARLAMRGLLARLTLSGRGAAMST